MKKLHLLSPLVLLALALCLAACGGGESDEDKIVEVIETSATSSDPADCQALSTQAFLEQTQFSQGKEAIESCEANAGETKDDPDSVEVSEVKVDGTDATADAAFVGGNFDGQTFTVALVEEDGDWKLNRLTGFAEFDQERLGTSLEEELLREGESVKKGLAECFGEAVRQAPQEQAEALILDGSPAGLVELINGCSKGQEA